MKNSLLLIKSKLRMLSFLLRRDYYDDELLIFAYEKYQENSYSKRITPTEMGFQINECIVFYCLALLEGNVQYFRIFPLMTKNIMGYELNIFYVLLI